MSKGPGRVQRVIHEMIAAEPDGAWTTDEICRRVYAGVGDVDKKHRVAVLRAIRRMKFPSDDWRFEAVGRGGEYCLFDHCSDESRIRLEYVKHLMDCRLRRWPIEDINEWRRSLHHASRIARAVENARLRREYRDATPIEKLNIQIRNTKSLNSMGYKQFDVDSLIAERETLIGASASQSEVTTEGAAELSGPTVRNYNPVIDAWKDADAEARADFMRYLDRFRELHVGSDSPSGPASTRSPPT